MNKRQHRSVKEKAPSSHVIEVSKISQVTVKEITDKLKQGIIPKVNSSILNFTEEDFKEIIKVIRSRSIRNKFITPNVYKKYSSFSEYIHGIATITMIKEALKKGLVPKVPLATFLRLNSSTLIAMKSFLIKVSMIRTVRDKLKNADYRSRYLELIKQIEDQIKALKQKWEI